MLVNVPAVLTGGIRFCQCLSITRDRSSIVGAIDGDLNGTRCTVDTGNVKGFVNAIADVQVVVSTVGRKGPVAGGVDIVNVPMVPLMVSGSESVCLMLSGSVLVNVPFVVRPAASVSCQYPGVTRDSSRIVGAIDGDLNGTRGAVHTGDVEGFVNTIADIQIVEGTVGGKGPVYRRGIDIVKVTDGAY